MRVLKFLFVSAVVVLILGGVGFLVSREILLFMGMANLRSAVSKMRSTSTNLSPYVRECQVRGSSDTSTSIIDSIQLRFTSDTEYRVEARCRQFLLDPILVTEGKLPPLVVKAPGTSGLVYDENVTSVTLTVWGRQRTLILENQEPRYTNQSVSVPAGTGPITSCQGYGFKCCSIESAVGTGTQIPQAADCPRSCYAACISRPIVLSFNSDPFFDPKTRQLEIQAGEPVNFNYVIDLGSSPTGTVTVDFGDGESETLTTESGMASHTYACNQASCAYQVQLKVTDARGTESAATTVTGMGIQVQGTGF